jgi:hypothetical protein
VLVGLTNKGGSQQWFVVVSLPLFLPEQVKDPPVDLAEGQLVSFFLRLVSHFLQALGVDDEAFLKKVLVIGTLPVDMGRFQGSGD